MDKEKNVIDDLLSFAYDLIIAASIIRMQQEEIEKLKQHSTIENEDKMLIYDFTKTGDTSYQVKVSVRGKEPEP